MRLIFLLDSFCFYLNDPVVCLFLPAYSEFLKGKCVLQTLYYKFVKYLLNWT